MDWSKAPDLIAVVLLAWAFASVARRSPAPIPTHWLTGWLLIVVHFAAQIVAPLDGIAGAVGATVSVLALAYAGVLFMRASLPYRKEQSSKVMMFCLLGCYSLYLPLLILGAPGWALTASAVLLGVTPLVVMLASVRRFSHFLRVITVVLHLSLGAVLLGLQHAPSGDTLALNATLFVIYFGCSIHFWAMYRGTTSGALISITGFFLWSLVFVIAPGLMMQFPGIRIESEVWNLPKYVVAVGMILLLLEEQVAHNKHLALHDDLTGLPNRRLFQDRLTNALERAKRSNTTAALLMVDLDHFKHVNDTLGHHFGDLLLKKVAELFSGRVRRSDTVARTGGDEFSVILEPPISRIEADLVGKSLLRLLGEPMQLGESEIRIGGSLGIAVYPDDAANAETLCIVADQRMYAEKKDDGHGPTYFRPRKPLASQEGGIRLI